MDQLIGWITMIKWLIWDNGIAYYWRKWFVSQYAEIKPKKKE